MYGSVQFQDAKVVGSPHVSVSPSFTLHRTTHLSGRRFDSLNAGNGFHSDIEALLEDKPVFQYAAFNWYEHAMLGGDDALVTLRKPRYASVLDIGTPSFWVWFLVLADYICTNSSRPESIISSAWEEDYKKLRLSAKYGTVLRDACLTKLFDMDLGMHNLLDDPSFELPGDA